MFSLEKDDPTKLRPYFTALTDWPLDLTGHIHT